MPSSTKLGLILLATLAALAATGCPPRSGTALPATQDTLDKEQRAFDPVNAERIAQGLAALTMDANIRSVARAHSEDMINRNFFSHTNPDYHDVGDRLQTAGISFNLAGENIGYNNYPDPAQTAVTSWMNSSGHRANILHTGFTSTGMGVAQSTNGEYYFTQVFVGTSKDIPFGYIEVYYDEPIALDYYE